MRLAVLGYGYWGPHLVRNFMSHPECTVSVVADPRPERGAAVWRLYPTIETVAEAEEALARPDVDAVAIAAPVDTPFRLAPRALEGGKHAVVGTPAAGP